MEQERTEELGLAARLPVSVGGAQIDLRTLNLDESEAWLAKLDAVDPGTDITPNLMLDLVMAYDIDGRLGDRSALRGRMTKRELYEALNQMVTAEAPFEEAARSVVLASGVLPKMPGGLMFYLINRSQQASSTNGHSSTGASPLALSVASSRRKGSSSSGATARSE